MLAFLSAYGLVITIVSGILGFILFFESRRHPVFRRPGTVLGIVALAVVLMGLPASLIARFQSSPESLVGGTTPIATASNSQSGTGDTPITTQGSSTQSPQNPSPTAPPPGTLLYQADSSWSGWSGSPEWKILNGMLVNDGTSNTQEEPTILAPYELGSITNYAVEANIQVVNWPQCCIAEFGMIVRASTNSYGSWQGYTIGDVINSFAGTQYVAEISSRAGDFGSSLGTAPFAPGNASHTYKIELRGNDIKLFIDGGLKIDINDNTYLSGGQVGLWSYGVQLNITSFKITAL